MGKIMNPKYLIEDSKHFCILPWIHLHASFSGNVLPCCLFNVYEHSYPLGNINKSSLNDIWFGPAYADLRKKLMNDEYDCRCEHCYTMENSGVYSLRQTSNRDYIDKIKWVTSTEEYGYAKDAKPISLDIRVSNICNFRCRTCFHGSSSSWYNDTIKCDPDSVQGKTAIIRNIYDYDKLFNELQPYLSELEEVYFCGGEPLLMSEQLKLLKYLDSNKLYNIKIRYNTNFSTLKCHGEDITDIWKNFNNIRIFASIDGMGRRGEYIRKGMVWDNTERNINHLLNKCDNIHFILNPTLSVFNVYHVPEMYEYFMQKGYLKKVYDMSINSLFTPKYYSIKMLPKDMKEELKGIYKELGIKYNNNYWYNELSSFVDCEDYSEFVGDFIRQTNKLDSIRNENILDVCPELQRLMETK